MDYQPFSNGRTVGHIGSDCSRDQRHLGGKEDRRALTIKRPDSATQFELGSVVACSLNPEVIDSSEPR